MVWLLPTLWHNCLRKKIYPRGMTLSSFNHLSFGNNSTSNKKSSKRQDKKKTSLTTTAIILNMCSLNQNQMENNSSLLLRTSGLAPLNPLPTSTRANEYWFRIPAYASMETFIIITEAKFSWNHHWHHHHHRTLWSSFAKANVKTMTTTKVIKNVGHPTLPKEKKKIKWLITISGVGRGARFMVDTLVNYVRVSRAIYCGRTGSPKCDVLARVKRIPRVAFPPSLIAPRVWHLIDT